MVLLARPERFRGNYLASHQPDQPAEPYQPNEPYRPTEPYHQPVELAGLGSVSAPVPG